MSTATRVTSLSPSLIRAMAVGAPPQAIDLGLGVPGWVLPEPARRALEECAARPEPLGYGPNTGIPELVSAIADHHHLGDVTLVGSGAPVSRLQTSASHHETDTRPVAGDVADRIMVTAGSQAALTALFLSHVSPGQLVLVPDPGFPAYATLARLAGAVPVPYRLGPRGDLDPAQFSAALDSGDVALAVINHPGNPTGGGATPEALAAVASAARAAGALLVSDEVYREVHLGPRPASLHDVTDTGVVVTSVSKGWAAPGLRVGWAVGDPALLHPARLVHNAMTTCAARPSQLAATALLRASESVLRDTRRELIARWSIAQTGPAAVRPVATPAGGFYAWIPLPQWAVRDPMGFCLRLRDEGQVIVVPGSAFGAGGADHVRVSCGGDPKALAQGLARMAPFWEAP
ncbi:pyridoxal phosphate-dependent aminotransferase [Ornithinimicrobium cryptoxanthini]|uniref:Aminotransferase n=1 Tax=Ornithinimicrobium cryptoxanthini TaxID=2934161 RepID=A0ABY4YL79_9MICO|nr:pyridoxal phosphate-dependent aminotransferase [Ornithinimicrobium cryptoxanthini]USQ77359.1 pyridoxal phosphate-dependent aminotransferase [Ornithinimicrobium cryptoxanthini]